MPKLALAAGTLAHRWGLSPWDPDWLLKAFRGNVIVSSEKARRELGWAPRYRTTRDVLHAVAGSDAAIAAPSLGT